LAKPSQPPLLKSDEDVDQLRRDLAQARDQLVRHERFAAVGLLVSDIAHEIYNPLAWVKLNTGLLKMAFDQASDDPASLAPKLAKLGELLKDNAEGLDRIQHVVDALRLMSRAHSDHKDEEDVNAICRKTIVMLNQVFKKKAVQVGQEWGELPPVVCNGSEVAQAVMNLLVNANDAVGPNGHVGVRTLSQDHEVAIEVWDDGPGLPPEVESRIFEPFVTTKPFGTGLGLPLVRSVADDHKGRVEWTTNRPGGTTFRLVIPLHPT
jgi:signal transduction histidine kinase